VATQLVEAPRDKGGSAPRRTGIDQNAMPDRGSDQNAMPDRAGDQNALNVIVVSVRWMPGMSNSRDDR
jgi:hypothetical protein